MGGRRRSGRVGSGPVVRHPEQAVDERDGAAHGGPRAHVVDQIPRLLGDVGVLCGTIEDALLDRADRHRECNDASSYRIPCTGTDRSASSDGLGIRRSHGPLRTGRREAVWMTAFQRVFYKRCTVPCHSPEKHTY